MLACCLCKGLCYDDGAPHAQSESFCLIGVLLMKAGPKVFSARVVCAIGRDTHAPLLVLLLSSEGSLGHRSTLPCNAADFPSVNALYLPPARG